MRRFEALDGWRGACALLVALHHLSLDSSLLSLGLIRNAYLFVDFFFVLSGFVITHSYWTRLNDAASLQDFTVRRFARVWPLHAFLLAIFVGVEGLRFAFLEQSGIALQTPPFSPPNDVLSIWTNLFLLHAMGFSDHTSWNYPSWSIGAEFWTYLIFGLVFVYALNSKPRYHPAIANLATVMIIIASAVTLFLFSKHGMDATFDYGLVRCVYGFFMGHLTYRLWQATRNMNFPWRSLEILIVAGAIGFVALLADTDLQFLAPVCFAGVVLVFSFEAGPVSGLLRSRPMQWVGVHSYTIYMVHVFVLLNLIYRPAKMIEHISGIQLFVDVGSASGGLKVLDMGSEMSSAILLIAYIAITLILSWILFKFLEEPSQNWIVSRWKAHRRKADSPQDR